MTNSLCQRTPLGECRSVAPATWMFAVALTLCVAPASSAQATFELLSAFQLPSTNGIEPTAPVQVADGSFYGTTRAGGAFGYGTIYRIDAAGTLTTVHSFVGSDGNSPGAPLVEAADGSLYGTTAGGGTLGGGTVFRFDPAGELTTIHHFEGATWVFSGASGEPTVPFGGRYPDSLVQAPDGTLYGITRYGGLQERQRTTGSDRNGFGTIFKIDGSGTLTTLHRFTGGGDGGYPYLLRLSSNGGLYGVTGMDWPRALPGAVFSIDLSARLTILYRSTFFSDDAPALLGVIEASDGNFYGWNSLAMFRLEAVGTLTPLYRFEQGTGGFADLIEGTDGYLYGASGSMVFRLNLQGTLTTLYSTGSNDYVSYGSLRQARDGSLYGTMSAPDGLGLPGLGRSQKVFRLDPAGVLTTVARFLPSAGSLRGGVVEGLDGSLYGTTSGSSGWSGVSVFKLNPAGQLTTIHRFAANEIPSPIRRGLDGSLYGTIDGSYMAERSIFKIDGAGTATTLYRFENFANESLSGVIQGTDGRLYGTVPGRSAGDRNGTMLDGRLFSLDARGGGLMIQRLPGLSLTQDDRGFNPGDAGIIQARDGSFYGTSFGGYTGGPSLNETLKVVVIFRTDASLTLTRYTFSVPRFATFSGVTEGADGNFFGTVRVSDSSGSVDSIFRLDPVGTVTNVKTFASSSDRASPEPAGVIQTADGSLYGTTPGGGEFGGGMVFRLDAAGNFTVVHSFSPADGTRPLAGVIQGADGSLYGTTSQGGPRGGGTIFRLALPANQIPIAHPHSFVVAEDTAINLQLTAEDADGNALAFAVVTAPEHGVLTGMAPHLTYTPAPNYFGADSFTFTVNDGTASSAPATVTITVTPVDDPPGAGSTVHAVPGHIEAEDYDAGGPGIGYHDTTPGNLGDAAYRTDDVDIKHSREGGFAVGWLEAGEWLAYTLDVAHDGFHTLRTRVGSPLPNRSFHFELDGRPLTGAIPVPQVADWDHYGTVSVPGMWLPAGTHVLRLVMGPLDYMDLQSVDIVPDAPARSVPARIEAEDYDAGGPGVGFYDATPGNDGGAWRLDDVDLKPSRDGGVAVGWMTAGEWLAYTVDVGHGGVYTLQARVGSLLPSRTFHLEVDGQDVTGPLAVPQFDDWDLYDTVHAPGVSLPAGRHVLRVVVGPEDYLDFDALTIVESTP